MYGPDDETRDSAPAAPVGVRLVVVLLLLCGLALAALPLTVYLARKGREPGQLSVTNASGSVLRGVRVVHLEAQPERLLGARNEIAPGETLTTTFEPVDSLHVRVEFRRDAERHAVSLKIEEPSDAALRIDASLGVEIVPGSP